MKPEAARFVEEMLLRIRREFYPKFLPAPARSDKQFFQERRMLIKAITWPARWMNEHGAKLPASGYQRILVTVLDGIKRHSKRAEIHSFARYFLHAVQEHMKHHGDQYYYMAKAARPISDVLPSVTRHVRQGSTGDLATETLAQINRVVRSPGGRRRAIQAVDSGDLFSRCKGPA